MNKQETLEEVAENYGWTTKTNTFSNLVKANELAESAKQDFIVGAKWQQERMFNEEEVINLLKKFKKDIINSTELDDDFETLICDIKTNKWFEQFKKK